MTGERPTGSIPGVVISAVITEGLRISVDGRPARLAIISDDGQIVDDSPRVAQEVESAAINSYRSFQRGAGHLVVRAGNARVQPLP